MPSTLLNRCTTPKIAGPEWLHTPIPKQRQPSVEAAVSSRDSTRAHGRLLSDFTEWQ